MCILQLDILTFVLLHCFLGKKLSYEAHCLLLLQKRVLRIITRSGWRDHSEPLFNRLGILNISQIYKLQFGECGVLGTSKDTFTSGNVIKEVVVEYRNHNGGP